MTPRRQVLLGILVFLAVAGLRPAWAEADGRFGAMLHEQNGTQPVGTVQLGADAHLTILSTPPERQAWLQNLVDRMNAKTMLHLDAIPPADAPRGAMASTPIDRADPRFAEALKAELMTYYRLELVPQP